MCGIIGYIGKEKAKYVVLEGLKALEYRGYDSAGVVFRHNAKFLVKKSVGEVKNLENLLGASGIVSDLGVGHTRWATHGEPNQQNTHPHTDCSKRVFLVHNGIVENYKDLKKYLQNRGHVFYSETDTEVVAHLVEDFLKIKKDFDKALASALAMVRGAYAFLIVDRDQPEVLYATRVSSPLVLGIGQNENFVASDPSAFINRTEKVVYLKDGEVAKVTKNHIDVLDANQNKSQLNIIHLDWDLEQAQKGDFPHFMLKEIFEGPEVVRASLRGRAKSGTGMVKLGGLDEVQQELKKTKRILILACGTSYYAGLVGEYMFEEISGIPVEVHFASEFRYKKEPFEPGTIAIAISQSGETADTLAALRKAKENGLLCLGIVNTVGSSIARETDAGIYNHAGKEIGVASTKAFLSQLVIMVLMTLHFGGDQSVNQRVLKELEQIPSKIQKILELASTIEKLAEKYSHYENFLFLGRRYNYPVAMEGALKLKEVSYVHAEGYGAGEMKHGPLAMVSEEFPAFTIVPQNGVSEKMISNIEEIRARKGPVLAIATKGDNRIAEIADDVLYIPETVEYLEPLLTVVPLQLFSYYVGVRRGLDVDKPRNLAKSVTVE